ncbi:alpha/beta hydrolase [Neorhodopirellula pilleata]|uniref:Endo-1,4-beta-xylanase Z n=1 Tax=Neorhodopirellula pilleata TaxID=2714738 RepID=A0A5C5ZPQ6_9BACT|nr:alpha/beta hydrolase-fold protein [Neorhodopirellula pilleata]TWT89492.1 Endo-1,4-beta-xylanase Z precursor [Neorhodopirellula pilleata]
MKLPTTMAVAAIFLSSVPVTAQSTHHSVVYDAKTLPSKIFSGSRNYAVYLPPGYETSNRSYPVLYLLHGSGDDQTGWVQFGEVQHIADKAIAEGLATPMVIVMPDAHTGHRGYFNDIRGDWNYEDFFFEEFVPFIEKTYRVKTEKRYRAVAGLSMGGGGSYMYALHHPEMFSSSCPLSAFVGPLDLEDARKRFNRPRPNEPDVELPPVTDDQIVEYLKRHNALQLIETMPVEDLKSVRWYIDCGDDDFLYEGNSLVHIAMRKRDVPHEYRVRDGGHRWSYWRSALPSVLSFVSEGFHQN